MPVPMPLQKQPRTPIQLSARQPTDPLQHRALMSAPHQSFVQAAFGKIESSLALTGCKRVARRILEHFLLREPARRARMQIGLLGGR